jgi:hypothetical protein
MFVSRGVVTMFSIGLFESATSSCFSLRTLIAFAIVDAKRAEAQVESRVFEPHKPSAAAEQESTLICDTIGKVCTLKCCSNALAIIEKDVGRHL